MLEQNLNDQSFSMKNIFSFAKRVMPEPESKSEGDKFLFLYCITAKLLSNRLYDNESAEDKINCLLSRIPEDKKGDAEQLKKSLETFVDEKDFSVDKVKFFFDTNKDLVNKIYGNEKLVDLLFFFAQMQSKNIFTRKNNEAFVNGIENSKVKQENLLQHRIGCSTGADEYSMHELNRQTVKLNEILDALRQDPNRIFNNHIDAFNKNMELKIFGAQEDEYKTKSFKLINRKCQKCQSNYSVCEITDTEVNCGYTFDIDKILEKKFSFKKINEISKDELGKLNLSYDEEFIYFLASSDFSNEYIFQNRVLVFGAFYNFKIPENIKPETTLKIYDYFVKSNDQVLIEEGINYLRDKFETSKDLLDTYDKLKDNLNFEKDKLLEIFIGNPPKVKQVLKCQDTKSPKEINTLLGQCAFEDIIDYFVDVDDNKNQDILSKYILQNPKILCNELSHVSTKLDDLKKNCNKDNNENKLKKLQDLMKSFFALENADKLLNIDTKDDDENKSNLEGVLDYYLYNDEGKDVLLSNIYSRVDELEGYFKSMRNIWEELKQNNNKTQQQDNMLKKLEYSLIKFLLDCKDEVLADEKEYIGYIVDMFELQEKFCMYDLDGKKEINVTDELKNLLSELIDKNLGLVENKNNPGNPGMLENSDNQKKDNKVIVEVSGKSYDLTKIYSCDYFNQNKSSYITHDPVKNLQDKIEFHKKILKSEVVSQEKKQTIYLLAKKYKEKLQEVYERIGKQIESEFNENIKKSHDDFLTKSNIDSATYNRLKNANNGDEIINRKTYLEKRSNVTNLSYLKENWTTWLSFIFTLGIMALVYIFIWKPKYENEISQLWRDLNNIGSVKFFENKLLEKKNNFANGKGEERLKFGCLNISFGDDYFDCDKYEVVPGSVAYKFSSNGKKHQEMINEMDKFIEQYRKDFEPEEIKRGNIILGLKPEMEKTNINKSNLTK